MKEKIIELFDDQIEVLKRIEKLRAAGYDEDDMYIVVADDENIEMLRGSTGVMIAEEEESLFDRFKSFLSGNDSVTDAFNRMELEEQYRDSCYDKVKSGKILLMVNQNYESKFELGPDGQIIPPEREDPSGTTVDRSVEIDDSEGELPEEMRRDIGLDVSEPTNKSNILIEKQIAQNDIDRK